MVRFRIFISGKVQGVFYRANTKLEAQKRGITGWVRNLPDGRVEAVFEGPSENVGDMVEWCRKGSSAAVVESVKIAEKKDISGAEFTQFNIRR